MGRRSPGDGSLYYRTDKQLWVAQYNGHYRYSKDKAIAKAKPRNYLRGLFVVALRRLIFVGFLEVAHTANIAFYIL